MPQTATLRIRKSLMVAAAVAVASVVAYAIDTPSAIVIALVPMIYTVPVFVWLDQLEPEPQAMRWNAFLWGAGVTTLVASVANEYTVATAGDTAALVISAPVVEEIMKTLGILGAAKRRQIDTPLDGAVYAGYVGLGFAMVENVIYFSQAISDGDLGLVFVLRGLFSPLAHPYFTLWVGLAVGKAARDGRLHRLAALRGLVPAILLHASWNATGVNEALAVLLLGNIALFFVMVRRLHRMRRDEIALVRQRLPQLAFAHNLSPLELDTYGDIRASLRLRRQLPRAQRAAFDERRLIITRLALKPSDRGTP